MPELNFLSAVSMAKQIRGKSLSPVELVEAHLGRVEALNPKLNALCRLILKERGARPVWLRRQSARVNILDRSTAFH
jgi:Asp-tRNA(Asn)/Glu-tRNA(Gln) amidotransferase A subunit family amidase